MKTRCAGRRRGAAGAVQVMESHEIGQLARPRGQQACISSSACAAPGVVDLHAQPFEISLNPAGHNINIHPAAADLIQRRDHLG